MGSYEKSSDHIWTTQNNLNPQLTDIGKSNGTASTEEPKLSLESIEDSGIEIETRNTSPSVRQSIIGFAWGTFASLLIATGTSFVQLLEGAIPDFQLTFMRSSVQTFLPLLYYCFKREVPRVERRLWGWLFIYCVFNSVFNITNYMAINYIAAGVASSIRRSVNVVTIGILAVIFLKEKITIPKCAGIVLCVVGVVMCVQPWYEESDSGINNNNSNNNNTNKSIAYAITANSDTKHGNVLRKLFVYVVRSFRDDRSEINSNETLVPTTVEPTNDDDEDLDEIFGYALAFLAGLCISFCSFLVKFRFQKVKPTALNIYSGVFGIIVPIIVSLTTEKMTFPTEPEKIVYTIGQALCWGFASVIGLQAISKGSVVLITLAFSLQIVFLLFAQYTFLSHINPGVGNWVEITGVVLVVVAVLLPPAWQALEAKFRSSDKGKSESTGYCFNRKSEKYTFDYH